MVPLDEASELVDAGPELDEPDVASELESSDVIGSDVLVEVSPSAPVDVEPSCDALPPFSGPVQAANETTIERPAKAV